MLSSRPKQALEEAGVKCEPRSGDVPTPSLNEFTLPEFESVSGLRKCQTEKREKQLSFLFLLGMDMFCSNLEFNLKAIYSVIFA